MVITLQLKAISVASEWYKFSEARNIGYEDRILWKEVQPDGPEVSRTFISFYICMYISIYLFHTSNFNRQHI